MEEIKAGLEHRQAKKLVHDAAPLCLTTGLYVSHESMMFDDMSENLSLFLIGTFSLAATKGIWMLRSNCQACHTVIAWK